MNFALILFVLLVGTGAVAAADRWYFAKRRAAGAKEPWWIEYPKSFFPVILIVFALRSFIVEPFKIPSGSMIPTLLVGDFILVNKFTYGIRLPIVHIKLVELNAPQRGDVMVFRFPADPSTDYIKRVIGVPGDKVSYANRRVHLNGEPLAVEPAGEYLHKERMSFARQYVEKIGDRRHMILVEDGPGAVPVPARFPFHENCSYNPNGMTCTVPPGHYFVMGDNRDNSSDSRVWGFVPDRNIVGKAFFIWFNFSDLKRFGSFQ